MRYISLIGLVLFAIVLAGPFATAATLSTTTMTWVVASVKSISVSYGAPCTASAFFFVESNAQWDPDTSDANWARAVPQGTRLGAGDTNCQSSSQSSILVTNNGTSTVNLDGNFASSFTGQDVNLVLKVWMGTGSGCGTFGLGGYEEPCSVSGASSAVTATTCKKFNSSNATTGSRLATSLAHGDTNQLCFSGDLNGIYGTGASSGDHNASWQIGGEFS